MYIYICTVSCSRVYFIFQKLPTTSFQRWSSGSDTDRDPTTSRHSGLRKDASWLHHAGHGGFVWEIMAWDPGGLPRWSVGKPPRGGCEQDQWKGSFSKQKHWHMAAWDMWPISHKLRWKKHVKYLVVLLVFRSKLREFQLKKADVCCAIFHCAFESCIYFYHALESNQILL